MTHRQTIKTEYFKRPWTWIERGFVIIIVNLSILYLEMIRAEGASTKYLWITYVVLGLLTIFILGLPKDDLAVDSESLYHIRRSIFSIFNRTDKYLISNLKSIRRAGMYSGNTEIFKLLGYGNHTNTIEMTFNDNSSRMIQVTIYKEDIDVIVDRVRAAMN